MCRIRECVEMHLYARGGKKFELNPDIRISATAKSGRQLSLSAASIAGYKRCAKCVLMSATRCPPAENPITPILCGSMCHSAACKRTSPIVRCASSNAVGAFGFSWHWGGGVAGDDRDHFGVGARGSRIRQTGLAALASVPPRTGASLCSAL